MGDTLTIGGLPPLPAHTDIEVTPTADGEGLRIELKPRTGFLVSRWAAWLGIACLSLAMTGLAASALLYREEQWVFMVLAAALTLVAVLVALTMLSLCTVRECVVTMTLNGHSLSIEEKVLYIQQVREYHREEISRVYIGNDPGKRLSLSRRREGRPGYHMTRSHKPELCIALQNQADAVASCWSHEDLCWIGNTITQHWQIAPGTTPTPSNTVRYDIERLYNLDQKTRFRSPFLLGISYCFSLGVTIWMAFTIPFGLISTQWPSVEARFVEVRWKGPQQTGGGYVAEARYTYVIDGERYERDRVDYGYAPSSDRVRQALESRVAGDTVRVYYDPDRPTRAVLVPGVGWASWMLLGIGVLFLGFALQGTATRGKYQRLLEAQTRLNNRLIRDPAP